MLEENEQQPTSIQRTLLDDTPVPQNILIFIPEEFRDSCSCSKRFGIEPRAASSHRISLYYPNYSPEIRIFLLLAREYRGNVLLAYRNHHVMDQLPLQASLLEYLVIIVGLCAISSPKQQQRDTNRCCKG
jgi:hypothetical protein